MSEQKKKANLLRGFLMLLITSLVWGTTFPVSKQILVSMSPLEYIGLRFTFAIMPTFTLVLLKGKISSILPGTILGFAYFLGMFFQCWGITYTTASNAGFIVGMSVIMVYIGETLFYQRRSSLVLSISVISSIIGLYLLSCTEKFVLNFGDLLVLISAFFWAVQVMLVDRFSKKHDLLSLNFMQVIVPGVVGLFLSIILGGSHTTLFSKFIVFFPQLFYLAFVCSAFAMLLQLMGQKYITPTLATLILLMEAVFSALFSRMLLMEYMSLRQVIGASLITFSMTLASLSKMKS